MKLVWDNERRPTYSSQSGSGPLRWDATACLGTWTTGPRLLAWGQPLRCEAEVLVGVQGQPAQVTGPPPGWAPAGAVWVIGCLTLAALVSCRSVLCSAGYGPIALVKGPVFTRLETRTMETTVYARSLVETPLTFGQRSNESDGCASSQALDVLL